MIDTRGEPLKPDQANRTRAVRMVVTPKTTYYFDMDSPVGTLLFAGSAERLAAIYFQSGPHPTTVRAEWIASERPFQSVVRQLKEYFAGRRRHFEVPLEPTGTPFQRAVWQELTQIPYGKSTSYGEIARCIGHPLASRAVGRANGANPWPIVVPCHRVIGANRSLTGFGGGLAIKQRLLLLEAEADGQALLSPPEGRVEEPTFSTAHSSARGSNPKGTRGLQSA
jgi:methylated-DNA-[protein]-cysteine S-methyltransferase